MNPAYTHSAAYPGAALLAGALLAALLVAGCGGFLAYTPAGIEDQVTPEEFLSRRSDDASLADLVKASGYQGEWPPDPWRLDTLTLIALYFNSELDIARARALTEQTALAVAARRSPLGLNFAVENHSREIEGEGPWSLGVALELPIGTRSRREARVEKAALLADAAEIEIASAAWRVRSAVRDALIHLLASGQRIGVLEQRLSIQKKIEQLVQRRVDAGMQSSRELGIERIAAAAIESALALENSRYANARGELARALALPLETVQTLSVADDALTDAVNIPDASAARYRALHNRLDIHTRLLEFGAADAEVRLAIAEQYPTFSLRPGYFWDQADNIWFLLTDLIIPVGARDAVRLAEARRETAARRFAALQIDVIGEVDQVGHVVRVTRTRLQAAGKFASLSRSQYERTRRLFDSGKGDQVTLAEARLADVQAQQFLVDAQQAWRESIARFEDATQFPVLSNFLTLPQMQTKSGPDCSGQAVSKQAISEQAISQRSRSKRADFPATMRKQERPRQSISGLST